MHTALFPICASLLSSCILWTVLVLIWCRWWIKADTCWKGSRTCTCLWRQFGGQSVGEGKAKPSIGPFESAWAPICGDESCYKACQPAQGTGWCRSDSHCHNHAWWSGLAVELGVYVIIFNNYVHFLHLSVIILRVSHLYCCRKRLLYNDMNATWFYINTITQILGRVQGKVVKGCSLHWSW